MSKAASLFEAKQRLLEIQKRGGLARAASAVSVPEPHRPEGPVPLSFSQEQVWRLEQIAGKLTPLYNESITIHRSGPCDIRALEKSFAEIIRRHEIWRTTFEVFERQPVQVVHSAPATFKLPITDLRSLPVSEREKTALYLAEQDAKQSFNLSHGPLMRARLVSLTDTQHCLFLTAHQIIVDGITVFDIFPSELTTLYESFTLGKPSPLPELTTQYADFARWQRGSLRGGLLENQLVYWQNQLAGDLPVLHWPNAVARPDCQTYRNWIHPFRLTRELTQALRDLGRREGVTLFMILLSCLMTLLYKYTSQQDIIVGTLAPTGRTRAEFQRLMGYFLNPVPLRAKLPSDLAFSSLLRQMRAVTLGAISNDTVTLEHIAQRLRVTPDRCRSPFFTVVLSVAPDVPQLPLGWSMTFMDVESGGGRWDLYLEMSDRAEGMIGRAQYNPDIFTNLKITQILEDFQLLLETVAADPGQRMSDLADSATARSDR
jgi:surfactin family lipopeptide synthetase A